MRTIVSFAVPIDHGNELIRSGKLAEILQSIVEELQPEAAYFYTTDAGERAGSMVLDLKEGPDLAATAEPFFLALHARVTMRPCFGLDDMEKLGDVLGPAVEKWG